MNPGIPGTSRLRRWSCAHFAVAFVLPLVASDDEPTVKTIVRDLASFRVTLIPNRITAWVVRVSMLCVLAGCASVAAERFEFTRLIAHWSGYADPGYLSFVDDVLLPHTPSGVI